MRRKKRLHRRERKFRNKKIIISMFALILFLSCGYAAFQTQISINAKGTIKDLQKEVDSKVPTNELLFWGQANNNENTLTTLKDKSGNNNDGTLYNFDNTNSGFINNELVFDGVDDYVDLDLIEYDFNNSQSYVVYFKLNNIDYRSVIIGSWTSSDDSSKTIYGASGIYYSVNTTNFVYDLYNGVTWSVVGSSFNPNINQYYCIIVTYDNATSNMYINGDLENSKSVKNAMSKSSYSIKIGSYVWEDKLYSFANMNLKEVMIYNRALTDDEVKTITDGFQKKYE